MKPIRLQKNGDDGIITIGEYIKIMQPWTYINLKLLCGKLLLAEKVIDVTKQIAEKTRDITEQILAAADVSEIDKQYARIMQERPFPGRGGLLRGEKEEALY